MRRLHRWFDRHPLAGDHLIAAVTALLVLGELASGRLFSSETYVALTTEEIVLSLALVAPLAFGPRAPVAVFATVMVAVRRPARAHRARADRRPGGARRRSTT